MSKSLPTPQAIKEKGLAVVQQLQQIAQDEFCVSEAELSRAFGLSDFLSRLALRYPNWINECSSNPPQPDNYRRHLTDALAHIDDETEQHKVLREFRNKEMFRITWHDFMQEQEIKASLRAVSELADALILCSYHWYYNKMCKRWETPMGSLGPQHMLILGMGKLGGRELNFSSDIDLIFVYPETGVVSNGRKEMEIQQFFTKIAQKLIASLHQITAEGQVYRVDMRLRPFGDSGPLVSHFSAFEDYYLRQGREWERYAMVKARLLNDDTPYTDELQQILQPFVFRRYIDFSVMESLRGMKQLIQQEVRRRNLFHNIKLGSGGIRELEFIVQCLQLIRGGRDKKLQVKSTLETLKNLAFSNIFSDQVLADVGQAYLYLRKVEHCLQQFDDRQTQELPDNQLDCERLAYLMAEPDYQQFHLKLSGHMQLISEQFEDLIGDVEANERDNCEQEFKDLWLLELSVEESNALLKPAYPALLDTILIEQVMQLKQELASRPIGTRGREIVDRLLPVVLSKISTYSAVAIELTLPRVGQLIKSISRRTTYLELLLENNDALEQLLMLCRKSPWIAEELANFPILLDELVNRKALYEPTPLSSYEDLLRQSLLRIPEEDLEQQMEALRQFKRCQQLRVAAEDISGALPIMQVSDHLTCLAEVLVNEAINMAWQQMTEKYGYPVGATDQDKRFVAIGYGKMGGIELGYSSDLDMVFLSDCKDNSPTSGNKSIESKMFYVKLAQRIIHLFNTKTASGELYELDMRLRPSGNSGLLVSDIDAFLEYQRQEAWVWEHQALVRSRPVAGSGILAQRFQTIKGDIICQERESAALALEVHNMRLKMREHLDKSDSEKFDLKQGAGGIADIEFLVQYWTLLHAKQTPDLTVWSDNVRLLDVLHKHEIISDDWHNKLLDAYLDFRNMSHRLALKQLKNYVSVKDFRKKRQNVIEIWDQVFSEVMAS
ncbi:MAG: bifunctional [glutamate--ammonia ligase]-adenylyl-L-tyrosine phosphorylase/[glutamate--ammonia-ligase] adenylyltransferase [Alteromonadaceae bacterium]|nr:bifunctional [glutamate--ammonia ligase]-adenylyl-L-tyrosine phosphorylase/[glutamate--ammonia-ligase] adenylyltransferase [Alteromonadaceae bacterium]